MCFIFTDVGKIWMWVKRKRFSYHFHFHFFYFLNENWFFWRFYPSSGMKSKTRVFWKLPNQNKYIILFSSSHVSNNFHVFFLHAMLRLFWFFCVIIFIKLVASVSNYKFYLCVSFLYGLACMVKNIIIKWCVFNFK